MSLLNTSRSPSLAAYGATRELLAPAPCGLWLGVSHARHGIRRLHTAAPWSIASMSEFSIVNRRD